MRYYLLDESAYPDGKAGSVTGVLFGLENAQNINDIRDYVNTLAQLIPQTKASLRRAFLVWISYVLTPHKGLKLDNSHLKDLNEVSEMLSTRIKQWEKESEEREQQIAKEKLEEGRQEGRQEGEAALLSKMLELKFGPIPEWAKQNIDHADAAQLEQWAAKLLNASNLEDVFN